MTDPGALVRKAHAEIKADFFSGDHLATVVNSPPGAGKSTLVVHTAAELAAEGDQVPIVAQTNAQADDLIRSLARNYPGLTVGRMHGSAAPPGDIVALPSVVVAKTVDKLTMAEVIVSTAAKWGYEREKQHFPAAIIDEAYQMRSDQLMYVAPAFDRGLFVGDPGQLDPFTPVDDTLWRGYADGPVNPAVATVLHNRPDSPVHRLPVSWRLPRTAAPLVSDAFYPTLPFQSGEEENGRALTFAPAAADPVDDALDMAGAGGWAFLELDERVVPADDAEAIALLATVAVRLFERSTLVTDFDRQEVPLEPNRVAVGVVHRTQRAAARTELDRLAAASGLDLTGVVVDTANRLQGREFDIVVVLHPLSGRAATSEFHLETGRLCVLLSRHRHACIVVGRTGIKKLLDDHPMSSPIWLGAPIPVPDGWEANEAVLERLAPYTITV